MSDPSVPQQPARLRRFGAWLLRQRLRHLAVAAVLLLLAVSGLFGGLERAPAAQAQALAPLTEGSVVETGPYRIELDSVRTLEEFPGLAKAAPEDRWVAVVVEATGLGDTTTFEPLLLESVRAPSLDGVVGQPTDADPDGSRPDTAIVVDDTSRLSLIPPGGLTFRVALLWPQRGDAPVPTTVEVQVVGHTLRPSLIDGQLIWADPAPLAEGALPVIPFEPTGTGA